MKSSRRYIWLGLYLVALCGHAAAPALPKISKQVYTITQFGAVGDGISTNTAAIQKAIQAAATHGGGTVEMPAGTFLCGPIELTNRIQLLLDQGAVLRMLPLEAYPGGTSNPDNFISGRNLADVAITGPGMIDGQGMAWWPFAKVPGAKRPRLIALSACQRVLIEHVTLTNSPMFHIAIGGKSSEITVRKVTVRANASTDPLLPSHNTDACDVTGSHVLIQDCDISVGDDNFTCGGGTSDVLITNCVYGYGHGVSIGSRTAGGVSNLTVVNCSFNNTDAGIRIKSDRDRGGLVQKLSYLNLRMTNVVFPILIYGEYMATDRRFRDLQNLAPATAASYPREPLGPQTPMYRDILFSNVTATAQSGRRAGLIWGRPEAPVTNVVFKQVRIRGDKPFGVFNAEGVRFIDCSIVTPEGTNRIVSTNAQVTVTSK
jgi:polygalacturonase